MIFRRDAQAETRGAHERPPRPRRDHPASPRRSRQAGTAITRSACPNPIGAITSTAWSQAGIRSCTRSDPPSHRDGCAQPPARAGSRRPKASINSTSAPATLGAYSRSDPLRRMSRPRSANQPKVLVHQPPLGRHAQPDRHGAPPVMTLWNNSGRTTAADLRGSPARRPGCASARHSARRWPRAADRRALSTRKPKTNPS